MHNGCYIKLRSIMPVTKQSGKLEKNHNFKTCCNLTVYIYFLGFGFNGGSPNPSLPFFCCAY